MENTLKQVIMESVKELGPLILVISGIMGIATIADFLKPKSLEKKYIASVNQTVAKSAGEDRIWSTKEKRDFLDECGLYNIILSEGQDIYFRVNTRKVDVIAGYNLENNGGFLSGSSANSGTKIGEIPYDRVYNKTKKSFSLPSPKGDGLLDFQDAQKLTHKMVKKVSNLEVLAEMYQRIRDKSVTPICKTEKFLQYTLHTGTTYLLNKPYILIKNSKRKLKEKIFEGLKETKKNIDELSFKTTFRDYKNGLFELNFMPIYCRIYPKLEDSVFGERTRFGGIMALLTDMGILAGLGIVLGIPDRDIKPYLVYIGAKVLSNGSSTFYEYFRKIKQELEPKNPSQLCVQII